MRIRIGDRSILVMQARALLADIGATVSMSRTGNCYDNAVTGSFFGTLKGECVERFSFQTRGQARQTIFEYVESFYVRSVQPKLTISSKGMAGKDMNLDNS